MRPPVKGHGLHRVHQGPGQDGQATRSSRSSRSRTRRTRRSSGCGSMSTCTTPRKEVVRRHAAGCATPIAPGEIAEITTVGACEAGHHRQPDAVLARQRRGASRRRSRSSRTTKQAARPRSRPGPDPAVNGQLPVGRSGVMRALQCAHDSAEQRPALPHRQVRLRSRHHAGETPQAGSTRSARRPRRSAPRCSGLTEAQLEHAVSRRRLDGAAGDPPHAREPHERVHPLQAGADGGQPDDQALRRGRVGEAARRRARADRDARWRCSRRCTSGGWRSSR